MDDNAAAVRQSTARQRSDAPGHDLAQGRSGAGGPRALYAASRAPAAAAAASKRARLR
jgi:hypothetical protein